MGTDQRAVLLFVATALVLAGCASSPGGAGDGHGDGHDVQESIHDPVDGAPDLTVRAVDIDFEPDELDLQRGEPVNVTVVNEGEALHDFTLEAADVHVNVEPGESATTSLVLDEPGEHQAVCTVPGHEEAGMVVDITVR